MPEVQKPEHELDYRYRAVLAPNRQNAARA